MGKKCPGIRWLPGHNGEGQSGYIYMFRASRAPIASRGRPSSILPFGEWQNDSQYRPSLVQMPFMNFGGRHIGAGREHSQIIFEQMFLYY